MKKRRRRRRRRRRREREKERERERERERETKEIDKERERQGISENRALVYLCRSTAAFTHKHPYTHTLYLFTRCRAVSPSRMRARGLSPPWRISCTSGKSPFAAAKCSAVFPS